MSKFLNPSLLDKRFSDFVAEYVHAKGSEAPPACFARVAPARSKIAIISEEMMVIKRHLIREEEEEISIELKTRH